MLVQISRALSHYFSPHSRENLMNNTQLAQPHYTRYKCSVQFQFLKRISSYKNRHYTASDTLQRIQVVSMRIKNVEKCTDFIKNASICNFSNAIEVKMTAGKISLNQLDSNASTLSIALACRVP